MPAPDFVVLGHGTLDRIAAMKHVRARRARAGIKPAARDTKNENALE
jgi:hypothetical protein